MRDDFLPLRLPPGADLRRALEAEAAAFAPEGCFVLSAIGSLRDPRLRLAGRDEASAWPGDFELLTLAGTLTADGAHLHMSIAGPDGAVLGGHVVHGNVVRTTVEALLCRPAGWRLAREADPATGYAELRVRRGGGP